MSLESFEIKEDIIKGELDTLKQEVMDTKEDKIGNQKDIETFTPGFEKFKNALDNFTYVKRIGEGWRGFSKANITILEERKKFDTNLNQESKMDIQGYNKIAKRYEELIEIYELYKKLQSNYKTMYKELYRIKRLQKNKKTIKEREEWLNEHKDKLEQDELEEKEKELEKLKDIEGKKVWYQLYVYGNRPIGIYKKKYLRIKKDNKKYKVIEYKKGKESMYYHLYFDDDGEIVRLISSKASKFKDRGDEGRGDEKLYQKKYHSIVLFDFGNTLEEYNCISKKIKKGQSKQLFNTFERARIDDFVRLKILETKYPNKKGKLQKGLRYEIEGKDIYILNETLKYEKNKDRYKGKFVRENQPTQTFYFTYKREGNNDIVELAPNQAITIKYHKPDKLKKDDRKGRSTEELGNVGEVRKKGIVIDKKEKKDDGNILQRTYRDDKEREFRFAYSATYQLNKSKDSPLVGEKGYLLKTNLIDKRNTARNKKIASFVRLKHIKTVVGDLGSKIKKEKTPKREDMEYIRNISFPEHKLTKSSNKKPEFKDIPKDN